MNGSIERAAGERISGGRQISSDLDLNNDETVAMCSFAVGTQVFGINASKVREVLGSRSMQRIPLAPAFIAGMIPNRGEVLTTVDLRALLGLEARSGARTVVVLEDEEEGGWFGLAVDTAGSMVPVSMKAWESNPSTLSTRSKALFDGAYKRPAGLMIRLKVEDLRPARLWEIGLQE